MKLATAANNSPDGKLVVVSGDGSRFLVPETFRTLQQAIENWPSAQDQCLALAQRLEAGEGQSTEGLHLIAALPRAWQWLDGSAFPSHGKLMQEAFKLPPIEYEKPLMYQGMSHLFHGPTDDIPFMYEEDGIDFEGEFGVIVDAVPMGTTAEEAMAHIKLLVQINDWSLRKLAPEEMKTGFGWIQAKPACSMAPLAITPDEAGEAWCDGRLNLDMTVDWNGARFGSPNGKAMEVGFHELVAHAAATRPLCAGTIIGSGTVSNDNFREVGSTCIAERRGMEIVDEGVAKTGFMQFGDRVRMEVRSADDLLLFGAIDQQVIRQCRVAAPPALPGLK
ncbi:MAG: fumarylacetoacetate hydrolase family protein [Pseudomonadales bacterium]|nr:fumarylacetoacetate hydrolase family protein [Pseudomonadales bacterium]